MREMKENLDGLVCNSLVVTGYNLEKSRTNRHSMYNCKCNLCGKEKAYLKSKLLDKTAKCSCENNAIESMRETRMELSKQKALKLIGVLNGKSKIVAYNEEETQKSGKTMIDLECSGCGKIYTAELTYVLKGKYKKCSECNKAQHFSLNTMKENMIGKTFGNYKVLEYSHNENNRSWWKCYNLIKEKEVVVSRDTLYQSERNKLMRLALDISKIDNSIISNKKIPFTFVDKY